ncbi:transporter [Pseudomonas aeruginosa]
MRAALLPTFGALSAALCLEARADAVALPPLALGNASFMDGVSRPGMLFELPLQYVRANNASDAGGHSVPGRQRVRGTMLLPHFAYLSQNTLLGAHYGAEVLLPLVRLDLDIDGGPDGRRTRQGDLIVSPLMLQWGPATLFGRPYWQRLNFVFSCPPATTTRTPRSTPAATPGSSTRTTPSPGNWASAWNSAAACTTPGSAATTTPRRAWAQTTYSRDRRCTRTSRSPTRWTRTGGSAWPATS